MQEPKPTSIMDRWMMNAEDEDDKDKDIDVIVGGELITSTAMLIGENSTKPAKERGWLAAISSANRSSLPDTERLQNVREIAKEAIRRGVLTEQQVNERLAELKIGTEPASGEKKAESPHLASIRTIATELAKLTNGLSRDQIATIPEVNQKQAELQKAIDAYKAEALQQGKENNDIVSEITAVMQSTGLVFERKQPEAVPIQPQIENKSEKKSAFPPIDYDSIAKALPLDEANPPKPDQFIQPIVTNMFGENDTATLAGKMIANLYDNMVKRTDAKPYTGDEVQKLLETSKETRDAFIRTIEEVNKKRQEKGLPPLDLGVQRQSGKDGFHFNGETRASQDFLFYFGKSSANYKRRGEPEVRAYVTIKPEERIKNQEYFVELAMRLYDAGVDFSAKAGSIFGVTQRTDNMVFYISASDQPQASQIIKDFLQEKNIGQGKMLAALPSPQEGLSWAMQPDKEQMEVWKKISGSTVDASFNVLVATMAMPAYLDRVADAHRKKGDITTAQVFEQEAQRIRSILSAA